MDNRHIVLKLFVTALEEPGDINDLEARKRFQKAVYLGQLAGVDLGYRYGWYLRGPYSPQLARDYYQLAEAIELGDREFENHQLTGTVRQQLESIRGLFRAPPRWKRSPADWLELLASWHYLRAVSGKNDADARVTMQRTKPALAPHIDAADTMLRQQHLLG
jgi:uncharacterized protein YwgA